MRSLVILAVLLLLSCSAVAFSDARILSRLSASLQHEAAPSSSPAAAAAPAAAPSSAGRKISVVYYVEAYCPRCIDVLTNSLRDAVKRVGDIMNLEVVPFGNGSEKNGVIECQHGARECDANTLQACAMSHYPATAKWFHFLVCMESASDPLTAASTCAAKHSLDYATLQKCASGEEGKKLLYKNARRTLDLNPPNKYVPWITINSRPFEDPENIVLAVCSQYTGSDKQKYCADTHRFGQ